MSSIEIITIILAAVVGAMTTGFIIMLRHLLNLYQTKKYHKEVIAMDLDGHMKRLGEFSNYSINTIGQMQIQTISKSGNLETYTLVIPAGGDWRQMVKDYGTIITIFVDFEKFSSSRDKYKLYPEFSDDAMIRGIRKKKEEIQVMMDNLHERISVLEMEISIRDEEKNALILKMAQERRKFLNATYNNVNQLLRAVDDEFLTAPLYLKEKIRQARERYIRQEKLISENLKSQKFELKKKNHFNEMKKNKGKDSENESLKNDNEKELH
ncbi:MAG: hypothetical protein ACTSVI_14180 [Promethearchaeota archaeon]